MRSLWAGIVVLSASVALAGQGLLLTPERVAEMRQRVKMESWAAAMVRNLEAELAGPVGKPIELPPRPGNWPHFYVCPKHGANLKQGKEIGKWHWEHTCSIDGEVSVTDPSKAATDYDAMIYIALHGRNANDVLKAGVLYQLTGEAKYATFVREMALAYAAKGDEFAANTVLHDKSLPGVVQWAGLDQAVWQIPMSQGVDCAWDTFSAEERQRVGEKVFLLGAERLVPQSRGLGNHQTWKDSAIGLAGYLMDRPDLVTLAIDGPAGFRKQMEGGVLADGLWFEGAWGYHNYTMGSLWPLVVAAGNHGTDLYVPAYKRMFDGPLWHAMPTGAFPMFNDTWPDGISRGLYPLAWARWKEPAYLAALPDPTPNGKEPPLLALIFGMPDAATTQQAALPAVSRTLPSGYTIFRQGEGKGGLWLSLKYGPHGGGHGHPDKNHFILYYDGEVRMPDFGSTNYASSAHREWARSTLAHNTLIVDGKSQKPATGKLLAFEDGLLGGRGRGRGRVQYSSSDAGGIYDGLRFVRTCIVVDAGLVVFVDRVKADREHDLQLAMHHFGRFAERPEGDPFVAPAGAEAAYTYLKAPVARPLDQGAKVAVQMDSGAVSTFVYPAMAGVELVRATGPSRDLKGEVPVQILRQRASEATFVWGVSLDGRPAELSARAQGAQTELQVRSGGSLVRLQVDSETGKVVPSEGE